MRHIYSNILQKAQDENYPYFTYALFQLISEPIYYLLWIFFDRQTYENIFVRILIILFCIPLLIHKNWPQKLIKYLPLYWYFVCCYSLPFFFTFMLLENNFSYGWSLNSLTGVVLCILFLDMQSLAVLVPIGAFTGWLVYHLTTPHPFYDFNAIKTVCITYGSAFIFGSLFAQRTRNITCEKLQTMKMLAGSIAHELRTPLSAMTMDAKVLAKFFPYYQDAYTQSKEAQLPVHKMTLSEEKGMVAIPKNMQTVSQNAHTMITMLLTNLNEGTANQKVEVCSMRECVTEALKTYPFSTHERTLLHWKEDATDFSFLGHKEFTKHVMFNLLKNALYAIASAGKGEIFITIEPETNRKGKNRLIFKDTGPGIPPENLRHIFDRFYTKKEHGAGIGLAFCKSAIQGFGGEITCTSREGEHTTFTISLPVLAEGT